MFNLDPDPVPTTTFEDAVLGIHRAIAQKRIIGFVSPRGVGFKFALRQVAKKHYLHLIVCDVQYAQKIGTILLSVHREISNVKFSRLNYENTEFWDLIVLINERIKTTDINLLVLDNCGNLTQSQLKYFVRFLKSFDRHTGLIFRFHPRALDRMKRKWPDEYIDLFEVTDDWRELESPVDEELVQICKAYGISDEMVISDMVTVSCNNLSLLRKNAERYINVYLKRQGGAKE